MEKITISDLQKKVLEELCVCEEGYCMYFRSIASHTKLEERQVRLACRALKRKGLAEYVRGLFDDDGMVAGSGYAATDAGRKLIEELNPPELPKI